jgi:nucleoside-diphosphate-sugar epimerase
MQKTAYGDKQIVCVTGASGLVGRSIVRQLRAENYTVRILTRRRAFSSLDEEIFHGDLNNVSVLKSFLFGARLLFHCAAEISDKSKMWDVNVDGTELLFNLSKQNDIEYFCYISSAGVVGRTSISWVDEKTPCHPQNIYERSKWAAEQIVAQGPSWCRVAILRPTNVVGIHKPGAIGMPMRGGWSDRLKVFLKGGECAHVVHADDVAQAALYLSSYPIDTPECFFVSCDHERFNTFGGLWSLYKVIQQSRSIESVGSMIHLPLVIPHILRRLSRRNSNYGNVRYSSEKLLSTGFRYRLGVEGAVRRIAETQRLMIS